MLVEMGDQLGTGEHRVVPQPARHGAGMAGLADTFDHAMADIAADAGDDADRQIARRPAPGPARCAVRARRRNVFGSSQRLARRDRVDIGADVAHALAQRAAVPRRLTPDRLGVNRPNSAREPI